MAKKKEEGSIFSNDDSVFDIDEDFNIEDKDNENIPKSIEEEIPKSDFQEDEVSKILKSFENEVHNNLEDDEYIIDPRTGKKAFRLDENGCRKGWEMDFTLGRCVPIKKKKVKK